MDDQEKKKVTSQTAANVAEPNASSEDSRCVKCGSELAAEQHFCPNCGQLVGAKLEEKSEDVDKPRVNKKMIGMIVVIVAIAVIIAIVFVVRGTQAKSVALSKDSITIKTGETASLTYVIDPDNTKNKTVTWHSSNELIAKVSDGKVSGVNEGNCIVTVTTKNGKTDACSIVIIPAGPDLQALYDEYCTSFFAEIAFDGSYLTIDTNPLDVKDYFENEAYLAIEAVNEALGLPESVMARIGQTRSIDGIQTYSTDEIELTWTYHPDKGLRVNYLLK